jgi:hypothetical protein
MVGGAKARGLPNDTLLVYTPKVEGKWRNVTLPHGHFWNEIVHPGTWVIQSAPCSQTFARRVLAQKLRA